MGFTYGKWEQNVIEFIKEKEIISVSWQWLGETEVHALALHDFAGYKPTVLNILEPCSMSNKKLMAAYRKVLSKADVVIGHNLDKFDTKLTNTDMILNDLYPTESYKTVDTLKIARTRFAFQGNSLQALGARLGLGSKVKHGGFQLWKRCMAGDMKAWALMKKYNQGDVRLLFKIYKKFLPWIKNHPNMNALDNHIGCPSCKSTNLHSHGYRINAKGRIHRYQCQDCGKWPKVMIVNGIERLS